MEITSTKDDVTWRSAQTIAAFLGDAPAPFANAVRAAGSSRSNAIDGLAKRLITGAFAGPFLRLVELMHPNAVGMPALEAVKLFSGKEIASILATGFMMRRVEIASPVAFNAFSKEAARHIEIGILLGRGMSAVGISDGMLIPATRWAGYMAMARSEPELLETYRSHLSASENFWCDLKKERSTWGATHTQVGALLLSRAGICSKRATALNQALNMPLDESGPESVNRSRIITIMVEALAIDREAPVLPGDDEFVMEESKMDTLLNAIDTLETNGPSILWNSALKKE